MTFKINIIKVNDIQNLKLVKNLKYFYTVIIFFKKLSFDTWFLFFKVNFFILIITINLFKYLHIKFIFIGQ